MTLLRPLLVLGSLVAAHPAALKLEVREPITSRVGNVHVTVDSSVQGAVRYTYGACDSSSPELAHHTVSVSELRGSHRLVWVVPKDAPSAGCVSSWTESGDLLGRSDSITLDHQWKRRAQRRCKLTR